MYNSEDLIKRSDTIKEIKEYIIAEHEAISEHPDDIFKYNSGLLTAIQAVYDMPFADRPQGEWIDKGWKGDWQFETDGRGNCWKVFECSLCNGWSTSKTRFCPHCGARMKGADDEDLSR